MARHPKATSNQPDSDLDAEQTLSIDHVRWSGFRDGVGERENGVDEQGVSIELLRLRKELNGTALPLTDRILRLIDFDRPGATRALRVDQDDTSNRLILVSERAPGYRLSDLLERGAERGVIPDLGAALYIMRRLLTTAAAIHRDTGIFHLAVAPERIVITPRGAVVLVEAAIAGAIDAIGDRMPVAVRRGLRLQRADAEVTGAHIEIARITIAGMAMIVGRPLDPAEDIDPLSPIVQEVVEVAAVRAGDQFAAALTPWLDHAISADPLLAFGDYADALSDLSEMVPPLEARCGVSRAPLRKFLDDLDLSRGHLETLEEDRLREIRARHVRRAPLDAESPSAAAASDAEEDLMAAIMEMPVAVEDLSSEISKRPVLVDDQPSAMAAVIEQAGPDGENLFAAFESDAPMAAQEQDSPATIEFELDPGATLEFELDPPAATIEFEPYAPVAAVEVEEGADASVSDLEDAASFDETLLADTDPLLADSESIFADTEPLVDYQNETAFDPANPMFADTEALISGAEAPPFNADRTLFNADPTLDDLVDEILRRGVESDLPDLSEEAERSETPEPFVFEEPPAEPPVDEPETEAPPVDEPVTDEPPAEEPPQYEPPVEEPPADEPPTEAPPPMWLRAAIEQVARTRDDRPAAPAPRRSEHPGPVFELHDEPEREREAETSTLSDIAMELGLTIPVAAPASGGDEAEASELPAAEPEIDDDTGWDTDIRKTLFAAAPEPEPPAPPPPAVPPRPVFVAEPEPIEAPEVFTPLPPQVIPELTATHAAPLPAAVFEPPVPAADAAPARSLADRTADFRESSGPFLKMAATLVLVVGGIAAAAFGGWRYYASLSTPGTLVVESTPPGAQVEIDGNQHGTTPLTLDIAPGTHNVALTRRGMTRRFEVAVRAGEQTTKTFDWTQVRELGSLAVTTDPPGAKVSVDGKAVGVTPLTIPDLPAGRRRIVLEAQGGTVRREVTIEADRTATLSEAIFSGFLAVFAPVELQIYEGNRLLGTTENSRIMIPAGRHELTLLNRELGSRLSRTVEVEPGQVAAINITEVPATVQPASAPPPAPQN